MADNVEIEKPSEPKDKKALLDKIQGVLEELLSKENVSEDVFIQQHMNAQMFIPLCILGGHRDIAELGPEVDVATLMTAAQQSEKLSVDEGQLLVRPVIRARRNTLILHDLPNEISQAALTEELQELFASSPEGEALTSVKPDVNRTAFVAFETDEAAQNAALWLRSQKLRGAAIKCAVKSEHFLRSFFPATPGVPAPVVTAEASAGASTSPPQVMMGWSQQWGAQQWPSGMGYDATSAEMGWTVGGAWAQGSEDGFFKGKGKGKINGKGKGKGKGKFDDYDYMEPDYYRKGKGDGKKGKGFKGKGKFDEWEDSYDKGKGKGDGKKGKGKGKGKFDEWEDSYDKGKGKGDGKKGKGKGKGKKGKPYDEDDEDDEDDDDYGAKGGGGKKGKGRGKGKGKGKGKKGKYDD